MKKGSHAVKWGNARFTCLLLSVWLAFSCGGNCIGTHAVKWGWRVDLSPALAFSCGKTRVLHLSAMRSFGPRTSDVRTLGGYVKRAAPARCADMV